MKQTGNQMRQWSKDAMEGVGSRTRQWTQEEKREVEFEMRLELLVRLE
jgi:hypothetical protein